MKLQDTLNILLDRDARGCYAFHKRDLAIVLDKSSRTFDQTLESLAFQGGTRPRLCYVAAR